LTTINPVQGVTNGTWSYSDTVTGNITFVIDAVPFYGAATTVTHVITKTEGDGGITADGNTFVWDRTAGAKVQDVMTLTNRGNTSTFTLTITLTKS
jgi:hypothetical protein